MEAKDSTQITDAQKRRSEVAAHTVNLAKPENQDKRKIKAKLLSAVSTPNLNPVL
jgi:hypothetical protein